MPTVTFSGLATLNYIDATSHWVNLTPSTASITGGTGLTALTVSGIPTGAGIQFNNGTLQVIVSGSTFKVALSGGVATISYTGGNPDSTAWATVLRDLQIDSTSAYSIANGNYTLTFGGTPKQGSSVNTSTESFAVTCFMRGTLIATPNGEVAVEALKPGDLVLTSAGETKPVNWIGRQTVSKPFADPLRVYPIRVRAGALGDNTPRRDLFVSPDHALLVDGVMANAGALVNGTSITREATIPETFVYYHVELDDHSLILAEGAPAETFVDNVDRMRFDNWDEFQALYPEGKTVEELPYPRAKSQRQVPVSVRVALAERAIAMGAADASQVA